MEGCGALPHAPAGEGAFAPRRTENRERRTERAGAKRQTFHGHRTRDKRATSGGAGKMWRVSPAGLTRRARRTTKKHEGLTYRMTRTGRLTPPRRTKRAPVGRQVKPLSNNYSGSPACASTPSIGNKSVNICDFTFWQSFSPWCTFEVLRVLRVFPKTSHALLALSPVAPQGRSVLRSLFSVLHHLGRRKRPK